MNELLSLDTLWNHWEGHRRLTLRTLEAFPEDQLLNHPVENMRSFAELMSEIVNVEESIMHGLKSGEWKWEPSHKDLNSKAELLQAFEQVRRLPKLFLLGFRCKNFTWSRPMLGG